MKTIVLRRLLALVPLVWLVVTLTFVVVQAAPGSYADTIDNPRLSPETRQAIRAHYGLDTIKVAEVKTHLEHLGHRNMTHGYASNALARLAEDGLLVKTAYARYRINGLHPELVALRLKLGQADLDGMLAREREIKEAEARGRPAGR